MGTLDDRRKGFEEQFRREEESSFRLTARRNRLFGTWAATPLGLSGSEADQYVKSVLFADLQQPGDDDIIAKVEQDLRANSMVMTPEQLRRKLDECAAEARIQMT